jgi:hypothetical protein
MMIKSQNAKQKKIHTINVLAHLLLAPTGLKHKGVLI